MRVFAGKSFRKWFEREGIGEAELDKAASEALVGEYEADLGGYLFKKRIARQGEGKSGGYRTILCFRKRDDDRIYFLHGFAKGEQENISLTDNRALKKLAKGLVSLTEDQLEELLASGFLSKVGGRADEGEK